MQNTKRQLFHSSFAIPLFAIVFSVLALVGLGNSYAQFNPPSERPPGGQPSLPTALSGVAGRLPYWQTNSTLGSASGLLWNNSTNTLTVSSLRIGNAGGAAAGKFLKSADSNGTATWDVDPTIGLQKRASSGMSCPTGQAISTVDANGNVTCAAAGGGSGFDFSMSSSVSSMTIAQGSSTTSTITVTVTAGVGQVVDFSIDPTTPLPNGVTPSFNPTWCAGKTSCTTVMTISASGSAVTGSTSFRVRGTSGTIVKTTSPISLTVNPGVQFTLLFSGSTYIYNGSGYAAGDGKSATATVGAYMNQSGGEVDFYYNLNVLSGPAPTITMEDQYGSSVAENQSLYFYSPRASAAGGYWGGNNWVRIRLNSGARYGGNFTIYLVAKNGTQTTKLPIAVTIPYAQ